MPKATQKVEKVQMESQKADDVTSHISEARWLNEAVKRIGKSHPDVEAVMVIACLCATIEDKLKQAFDSVYSAETAENVAEEASSDTILKQLEPQTDTVQ